MGAVCAGERAGPLQVCTGEGCLRLQAWRQVYSCRHRHHRPTYISGSIWTFIRRLFSLCCPCIQLKNLLHCLKTCISAEWCLEIKVCTWGFTVVPALLYRPVLHYFPLSLSHSFALSLCLTLSLFFFSLPFYLYIIYIPFPSHFSWFLNSSSRSFLRLALSHRVKEPCPHEAVGL